MSKYDRDYERLINRLQDCENDNATLDDVLFACEQTIAKSLTHVNGTDFYNGFHNESHGCNRYAYVLGEAVREWVDREMPNAKQSTSLEEMGAT